VKPLDVIASVLILTGFVLMVFGNSTGLLIGFAMCVAGVGAAFWRDEA
jgi:VIT1/CCC1 family predicted Fe2+/Mn2+ transporter